MRTLYTPVFFSSSEPPKSQVPSAYLNALSRTHIALAQIVQEVPSSRPGSPTEDQDGSYPDPSTQERVSALRVRVQEAWAMADGNPADGKWTLLTHLLRMSVTSGKAGRWLGTRADLNAPDAPDGGWFNASTEAEWAEWEKKVGLKDKVENWKLRLETHEKLDSQIIADTQRTTNVSKLEEAKIVASKANSQDISIVDQVAIPTSSTTKMPESTSARSIKLKAVLSESAVGNPLKDNSLFGFAVVKRSNPAVGKKPHANSNPVPNDTATIRKIADIPEMSFLPPSFPSSQMMTSTPNAKPLSSDKRKPEPIPFTASPCVDSARRVTKVSTSLPAIPPTTPPPTHDDTTHKRPLSGHEDVGHDRAIKKACTMPSLNSSPVASGSSRLTTVFQSSISHNEAPSTPKRQNLPTLTELLASTKKGRKGLEPKSAVGAGVSSDNNSKFRFPSPQPHPLIPAEDNPYMLDPYAISANHELDIDFSPTKSLSSLAGSDSEDEYEDDVQAQGLYLSPSSFNPYATSTQHHEGRSSPFLGEKGRAGVAFSLGFGGYNSQFDVAGQVDKVDKLLEKDVDYEGWLRDPSLEREGVQESP